jgi:lysyl-tRNA synthetase class 2
MADLSDLERVRREKLARLTEAGMAPYPLRAERTHSAAEAIAAFEAADADTEIQATVTGRIRSIRNLGKIIFSHIEDGSGQLQLYLRQDDLGDDALTLFKDAFDLGDFIQARGSLFKTRAGEISLHVKDFTMLAKAITPLPTPKVEEVDGDQVVHDAFSDPEARFRQRYVDLAVNPEVRQIFATRARIVSALRTFLDERGFLEVETPILQPIYGGAAARPFITHHNQLHQDLYLRISFELYLKRLLVGNLERVYEIGRDFRNEGVDRTHNPEFTQLEFYMAYANYQRVMDLAESMIAFAASAATGSTQVVYQGQKIELAPPWPRIRLRDAIAEHAGIRLEDFPDAERLRQAMKDKGHQPKPGATRGKLIESLLSNYVEPNLMQPAFLYDYPRDISPLAKSLPGDAHTVERFEGFAGGMELCNAFTELNDPDDQEQRFLEMGRDYAAEDEERHPMDEDYLRAMRYGMPPAGGFGMGVDRLTMLLTDQASIREVILFPHLRQREDKSE